MAKYLYQIEACLPNKGWTSLFGEQDSSLAYMQGRFAGFRALPGPRRAFRLIRVNPASPSDPPKVLDEVSELKDLSLGWMPAAYRHRWGHYVMASVRALRVAALDVDQAARNDPALSGYDTRLKAMAAELEALWTSTIEKEDS
jgi:hypothetical protein